MNALPHVLQQRHLLLGLFLVVWLSPPPLLAAEKPVNQTRFGGLAIKGYDPVAYFREGSATKGSKEYDFEWQGATWRFASAENRDRFAQDPEAFAPQYGGYCAWAVSQGYTADIDPASFTVHEGRLYLNYNAKIQARWLEDREALIEQADENWPSVLE